MKLVRSGLINKTNKTLTSAVRNSSCSRGWLRLVVQVFFGVLTVISFILIVMLSVGVSLNRDKSSRCQIRGCRILCNEAPLFDRYVDDIIFAVAEAEATCEWVFLTLERPHFINSTLPATWLSRLQGNVYELQIVGGNLRYIASQAFMSQFARSLRDLLLEDITIMTWEVCTLLGLSNLENLVMKNISLHKIERNVLQAVDDTLESLTITSSGSWNPTNLTGFSNLISLYTVDLSSNYFPDVLDKQTFAGLQFCRVLFLNSCGIRAIGAGAFDNLSNIKMLYLNNNFLTTVPTGLFDRILNMHPRPRLHLQDNQWLCDCSFQDLKNLSDNGMLIVNPTCYYPIDIRNQYLQEFYDNCRGIDNYKTFVDNNETKMVYINTSCPHVEQRNEEIIKFISPVDNLKCSSSRLTLASLHNVKPRLYEERYNILHPSVAIKASTFSIVEMSSSRSNLEFGLLWFQSNCPREVYCLTVLPDFLRIYNIDTNASYTFCPLLLKSGEILDNQCLMYDLKLIESEKQSSSVLSHLLFLYIGTALVSLTIGALCLYIIVRKFPSLLRGSSRILFVKHKHVDALVLPPKVPLRDLNNDHLESGFDKIKNYTVIKANGHLLGCNLTRSKSIRSGGGISSTPSYISALQPTEDQLADWRLRHHFNTSNSTVTSICTYVMDDSSLYCSLDPVGDKTYETLKSLSVDETNINERVNYL